MSDLGQDAVKFEAGPRELTGAALQLTRAATLIILLLAINQTFNLGFLIGYTLIDLRFFYSIIALGIFSAFLAYPISQKMRHKGPEWYDWLLGVAALVTCGYFFANSYKILLRGWEMAPPELAVYFSFALWALVLEAGRRSGGMPLAIIVGVLSLYPIYTEHLPTAIAGFASAPSYTAAYHVMGSDSIVGIPLRTFAQLIIGFILFGAALQRTGAGAFFMDLSFALLGKVRGGPAKVAIFSSGLMGSMSGSIITNVLTTAPLTVPAMRRTGIRGTIAAAIETCASLGGVLMPPVMGATAFVMASFMNISYVDVALAAVMPSVLYFFGLFLQIDSMAAKEKLKGLPEAELPSVRETLKEGWYFIFAFAVLIYMLLVMRREAMAPYFATPLLILLNQIFSKKHRWGWGDIGRFLDTLGSLFFNLIPILAAVGMIIGALSMTGVAATLVNDLLRIAAGNILLLLMMGALAGLVLGLGMTATAAYIFLAILLAPALVQLGIHPLAAHMFVAYWGSLSFITPPVALGAFAAASIAKTPPMRTSVEAMRFGSSKYFIPFFFVFDPALVLQGTASEIVLATGLAFVGVSIFSFALQGYAIWVGPLFEGRKYELPLRAIMIGAAVLLALPGDFFAGWSKLDVFASVVAVVVPLLALAAFQNRQTTSDVRVG